MSDSYSPSRTAALMSKITSGRVDIELDFVGIIWVIMLAVGYVAVSSATLAKFKDCEEAKKTEMYKSLESLLSHTMAIAITIPVSFLLAKIFNKDKTLWTLFYGAIGIIGSAVALDIARKCKKEGAEADKEETFAAVALALFGVAFVIAAVIMWTGRKAKAF